MKRKTRLGHRHAMIHTKETRLGQRNAMIHQHAFVDALMSASQSCLCSFLCNPYISFQISIYCNFFLDLSTCILLFVRGSLATWQQTH